MSAVQKRNTIQRKLVSDAVFELRNHPTADDIYKKVSETHKSISRGTVYRNLNYLVEDGFIRKVSVFEGADRFDHVLSSHAHLRCSSCGQVYDLPEAGAKVLDSLDESQAVLAESSDFEIEGYEMIFVGVCPSCQKKDV